MVGFDDTGSKDPVAEFSQEDEGHDEGEAGVGDQDVRGVSHHGQSCPSVALSHQTIEALCYILWGHQATEILQEGNFINILSPVMLVIAVNNNYH